MTPALLLALALSAQADVPLFSRPSPELEAGAKALDDRDYDRAIDLYRKANAKTAKERAVVEYNVGIAQLEKAQHLKMMEAVRQAQEAAGGQGEDATLDEAVTDTPDFDAAVDALERAYKLSDDSHLRSQAALGVGNSYALREQYKKAIDGYRRALVQDPHNKAARNNLRTTLRRMRMQQKPPKQQGEEGDEDESGEGESEEGEEGEQGQEGGESSEGEDQDSSDDGEQGEKENEGEQENEGDKNGEGAANDGNAGDEKRDSTASDDGNAGDQNDGEQDDSEQKDKQDSAGGDDKNNKEEADEDGEGSSSKANADEGEEKEKKESGEKPGDDEEKNDPRKQDAERQEKEGGQKPPPDEKKADEEKAGEKTPKDDPLKDKNDKNDKGQKGQTKDKPGQKGAGGTAKDKPQESLEKQRARAILDALRRRERPLGPVMMNPQPAPRRKVKKDW